MKTVVNRRFLIAVLALAFLTILLLSVVPTRSSGPAPGEYDIWLDWNNDGKINMVDIGRAAKAFGTNGTNMTKASIVFQSNWIDITDKCGQKIVIAHDLNSTDFIVDTQGKTSLDMEADQRHHGLGYVQGWNKTYGGSDDDAAFALVQTSDGGYALAGSTGQGDLLSSGFLLVKTNAEGNMQWNQTYRGITSGAQALVQTSDGGYALAGYTNSSGAGNYDFWLVKTDASGKAQWNETYGGTGSEGASAMVTTKDGGYALTGWTDSFGSGQSDFWLVKTNAFGKLLWNKTYGGTREDQAFTLVQTSDGGYALAGSTESFGDIGIDWIDSWLVKTDASGNVQWNQTYGGAGEQWVYSLVQTRDGAYALAGYTFSSELDNDHAWLFKTDANGTVQWSKTYGETNNYEATALVQTTDGGYALAGYTSGEFGIKEAWVAKTDVESDLAWVDLSANTITLYRGATDQYWNYVRVRLWKPR